MILTAGNYVIDNDTPATYPDEFGFSDDKVVWVWACDRDGMIDGVLGTQVQWRITGGAYIPDINADQISNYNSVTQGIKLFNGFVSVSNTAADDTRTMKTNTDGTRAISFLRAPTTIENQLFYKKWGTEAAAIGGFDALYSDPTGLTPNNFAVAGIDIYDASDEEVTVETILTGPDFGYASNPEGNVFYTTNVNFATSYPMDDPIVAGDANADGEVDAADITKVERIIMGLDSPNINADTNMDGNINMGDVVMINRIIQDLD
jgi:hypothetical protein